MESVLMGHPERVMPFCVRSYSIVDGMGNVVYNMENNYQSVNQIIFEDAVSTDSILLKCEHPSGEVPAAVFAIRCYE